MSLNIKVYFDFVCPFCFLGEESLSQAIEGKDVNIQWMPFELRPEPSPRLDPWNDHSKLNAWNNFIEPIAKNLGIDMKLPKLSPHPYTNLAFEGYHYASEYEKGDEYIKRVFKGFFQDELDIGKIQILANLSEEIGLNKKEFTEALRARKYKDKQEKALKHAYEEANITAVPTIIIGDEVVQGNTSKENLEKIINKELIKNN
ncbi:DsbA family protein [Clostridium botulinum]|uniref:DsbA family protein n=1 Tax=Clostridium botulinum TaxID=1491 RepID=A0A846J2F1_CLOBO|nr:DsbA family protein [Clostridium botulinum]ACA54060.1 DSBA-like thioredoxin domain protein [Clostridium botulinum A3 str. Loch Maree]NFH64445.1 DsbA family protein [Clostridium botulinum]NFJ08179.1 DsbA family protein [Clostridium botulinum]NFK15945.1 DsbA family protein [Clostridium botulinum]NFM93157.1 DsbA family protein [Clostridium botulinum]